MASLDYEALGRGLPDAVVGVDADLRIILWNPAAEDLLGRSARRVTGRALKEGFPPDTSLVRHLTNPLPAIRGAVQLMQRELGDEARWGEYTAVLLKEVTRVNSIIEMLLDLGRPVTLRAVPLNVHQLLERVALLLEEEAASLGVQFVRRYDPSLPPILADEDRILQVFHNLVRNAIEAMPRGGRLTLVTRLSMNPLFAKVDLGQGQKSLAEIQIAAEGQGISEAPRDKLFTPFFTTKDRGLGLGLALCHRIVDEHKGATQVTSEPGRGTAVSCFLPIAK